jgi:hypothetical protein
VLNKVNKQLLSCQRFAFTPREVLTTATTTAIIIIILLLVSESIFLVFCFVSFLPPFIHASKPINAKRALCSEKTLLGVQSVVPVCGTDLRSTIHAPLKLTAEDRLSLEAA